MWLHLVPFILSFFCSGGGAVVLTLIMDRVSLFDFALQAVPVVPEEAVLVVLEEEMMAAEEEETTAMMAAAVVRACHVWEC
jgi:hypothetical protein